MQGSERGIRYHLNFSLCFATGTTGRGALSPLMGFYFCPCDITYAMRFSGKAAVVRTQKGLDVHYALIGLNRGSPALEGNGDFSKAPSCEYDHPYQVGGQEDARL